MYYGIGHASQATTALRDPLYVPTSADQRGLQRQCKQSLIHNVQFCPVYNLLSHVCQFQPGDTSPDAELPAGHVGGENELGRMEWSLPSHRHTQFSSASIFRPPVFSFPTCLRSFGSRPLFAKMVDMETSLLSPPSEANSVVPLNAAIRTSPIHPDLPEIQVPGGSLDAHTYHPVTCQPLEFENFGTELEQLRLEFPTPEAALRAQQQAAQEARTLIQEAEKKREQVQKAIDKKIKERDTEMKVLSKYQEVKASDIPA